MPLACVFMCASKCHVAHFYARIHGKGFMVK
jgi:hypothetical protein